MERGKRIGYERPEHPDECDCPVCEAVLLESDSITDHEESDENAPEQDSKFTQQGLRKPA